MNQGNDSPRLGFSLTTKAVVVISLLLLAASLALGCVLVNQSRGAMKRMLDRRMLDAASAAAHQLDGAAIGGLQAGDSAAPAYQAAMATLRSFQESIDLHFIYGIREEPDGSFILTFDPSPTDTGAFGDPIVATDALRSAARGKAAVCAEPYQDKWGRFYSAYSPVFSPEGKVAGIVGVDLDASQVDAEISRQSYAILSICLASMLIGSCIVVFVMVSIRRRFGKLSADVGRLASGIDALVEETALPQTAFAQAGKLPPSGAGRNPGAPGAADGAPARPAPAEPSAGDEISALADRVRDMRRRVQDYLRSSQNQTLSMIAALAADYRDVFFVDLAADTGVCFRSDASRNGKADGEVFAFRETFQADVARHIHKDYQKDLLRLLDPAFVQEASKTSPVLSFRYLTLRGGRESWELMRIAPMGPQKMCMSISDVDAETRRSLEQSQALRQALAAAEEASRAKTVFLSSMSHEIRTPMNAIIGLDSIALSDPAISASTRQHLERIGSSARHLLGLINDILDMSRIESGRLAIASAEFSFPGLLDQVNTMIGGQCQEKGLAYRCELKDRFRDYYVGDGMKLKQVLINILGNAVKFTPAGGSVSLEVGQVAGFRDKATLRFVISDTGVGMDKAFLPKLFKPFSQEDSSSTSRYGSTGLGLAITKSIVELMHGRIDVESEKGKGTRFTVTVTLAESSRTLSGGGFDPVQVKALVVDEDKAACQDAVLALSASGIETEGASSAAEAMEKARLRHARQEPYTLVLAACTSSLDGPALARGLRAGAGCGSAVVFLAAASWDEAGKEAAGPGIDGFLAKPLLAGAVLEELRKVLARKRPAGSGELDYEVLKGRRVLLAEDNELNAEIMQMLLQMRGMSVDIAANGQICVEKFKARPAWHYDAILMDMRMPEMDGIQATAAIRRLEREDAGRIPVIALTANAFNEDVVHSLQSGLDAHLSKPVEPELLYRTLTSFLSR